MLPRSKLVSSTSGRAVSCDDGHGINVRGVDLTRGVDRQTKGRPDGPFYRMSRLYAVPPNEASANPYRRRHSPSSLQRPRSIRRGRAHTGRPSRQEDARSAVPDWIECGRQVGEEGRVLGLPAPGSGEGVWAAVYDLVQGLVVALHRVSLMHSATKDSRTQFISSSGDDDYFSSDIPVHADSSSVSL